MSTINDSDEFLVQRGTASYKQNAKDLMSTIQDTDLMLVQRGTASYKVDCKTVKDQLGGSTVTAPVLDSVVLSQDGSPDANRFTSKSFTSTTTNSGGDATTLEMTGTVTGALGIKAGSDPITANAYPGTSSTDVVLTLEGEENLGDVIQQGDTVTANVSYTPETDVINSVTALQASDVISPYESVGTDGTGTAFDNPPVYNATYTSAGGYYKEGPTTYTWTLENPWDMSTVKYIRGGDTTSGNTYRLTFGYGDGTTFEKTYTTAGSYAIAEIDAPTKPVTSVKIDEVTDGIGLVGFYDINGTSLIYPTSGNKLTLSSEKDIALFQVDDVVQTMAYTQVDSSVGTIPSGGAYGNWGNVFNGVIGTSSAESDFISPKTTQTCTIEFDPPIPASNSIKVYGLIEYGGSVILNDSFNVAVTGSYGEEAAAISPGDVAIGNQLRKISVSRSSRGGYLAAVKVDDKLLVDTNVPGVDLGQVKVTATNVSAKTITVDGGSWTASTDKVSTTSAKQGSGTVSDITNAQVTISPFTDNCFKVGQYLTVNKTINVNPKTDKITSYVDSTKVITVDGQTDLAQFADGDDVFMTDNSGSGASTKTGYKLTTTDVQTVQDKTVSTIKYALASTYVSSGSSDQTGLAFDKTWATGQTITDQSYIIIDVGSKDARFEASATASNSNLSYSDDLINWSPSAYQLLSGPVGGEGRYYWTAQFIGLLGNNTGATLDTFTPSTEIELAFPGAASTNPDLAYFKKDDIAQDYPIPPNTYALSDMNDSTANIQEYTGYGGGGYLETGITDADQPFIKFTPSRIQLDTTQDVKVRCKMFISGGGGWDSTINKIWTDKGDTTWTSISTDRNSRLIEFTFPADATYFALAPTNNDDVNVAKSAQFIGSVVWDVDGVTSAGTVNVDNKYMYGDGPTVGSQTKVVSVDTARNKMTVDGGNWLGSDGSGTTGGDTKVEYQTTGGVGTIATGGVSFTNKTITLTAAESGAARWIADNKAGTVFRVATAQKAAVATTAYLKFSADGSVTGYQATPVDPRVMNSTTNPKLTFPATFPDTGQAPDTEFPGTQTYIQTSVQLKNSAGNSSTVASNNLVPQTNQRSIGPGAVENNADDVRAMGMQIATHDQRVADHTAAKRQQAIADFEANLRRYTP